MEGSRPPRVYRGSRRRLRRITMRGNWTGEIWLVLVWVLFLLFVVIPWMSKQGR